MSDETKISAQDAAALDLRGRAMLSQQGRTVTRGLVSRLVLGPGIWDLELEQVDYLDRASRQWERRREEDSYGGQIDDGFYLQSDGRLTIHAYGMIIHIAPAPEEGADLWAYDWPKLDNYGGGPM